MLGTTTFPLVTSADLPKYIASSTGDVTLATVHAGVEKSVTLTPVKGVIPTSPDRPAIGIAATAVGMKQLGIVPAFIEAVQQSVYSTYAIIVGLGSLIVGAFTLSASLGDVSGPVGIAGLVGDAATLGWGQVLVLAALISLNLAVVNLLPFPALDGGRLIMVAYEALARKPIPLG